MLFYLSLFFILYLPFQIALNPASGVDLASGRLLAIFLFLLWAIQSLKNKKFFIPNNLQTTLFLSFIFLSFFSIFFAANQPWAWRKMLFLLSFLPLYFIFAAIAQDSKKYQKIVNVLVYGGALAALVGLIQFSLQFVLGLDGALNLWQKMMPVFLGENFGQSVLGYSSWLVNAGDQDYFRAIAFFPDPHMFSLFLGLILPWSIMLAFKKNASKENNAFVFWIIPLLIFLADLFTFSRGGYLGLIGGMILAVYWLIQKYRQRYVRTSLVLQSPNPRPWIWRLLILSFFLIITLLFVPNPLSQRLTTSFSPGEGSNQERLKNWNDSLKIIQNNPLMGTGLGNYSLAVKPTADYRDPIYAHNLYLDIAAETGIFNSLIFIALLISAIRAFWRRSNDDIIYLGGAGGLVIFAIHSIFETGLYSVHVLPLLTIILALSCSQKKDDSKNN